MPSSRPSATCANFSGTPSVTVTPFVTNSASPRSAPIVPSVATNGGMCSAATSAPFSSPATAPTATPIATPAPIETPCVRLHVPATPLSATMLPTDKSMPPVMITNVMPSAMMLITDTRRATSSRLASVRNRSFAIVRATAIAIRPANGTSVAERRRSALTRVSARGGRRRGRQQRLDVGRVDVVARHDDDAGVDALLALPMIENGHGRPDAFAPHAERLLRDERVDRAVANRLHEIRRRVEADDGDFPFESPVHHRARGGHCGRLVRAEQAAQIGKACQKILRHSQAARPIGFRELIADDGDARKFLANRVLKAAFALEARSGPRGDAQDRDRAASTEPFAHPARREHA